MARKNQKSVLQSEETILESDTNESTPCNAPHKFSLRPSQNGSPPCGPEINDTKGNQFTQSKSIIASKESNDGQSRPKRVQDQADKISGESKASGLVTKEENSERVGLEAKV